MSRSLVAWVAFLSLATAGCTGGGGGGGGGSNEAPDAIDDTATTGEDTPVTIDATANDTDADDDVLLVASFTVPANGTVFVQGDGSLLYTPDLDFAGTDTFTYVVTDGPDVDETPATVTVTVNAAGDAPVAASDAYDATEDTLLTIDAASGVLGNDSDTDSSFTAAIDQTTADGTLSLAADGSFTYQPDANFDGVDSFTYHATDGATDSSVVTVTITVGGVNDAPVADADGAYAVTEDVVLTVPAGTGVLNGDTDVDGDSLSAQVATGPSSGSLALNADGSFTYTPNANFNGSDSFTYTAGDGALSSTPATVSITVNAANDAPVTVADAFAATEDTTLSQAAPGVLANDTDIDAGATLTAVLVAGPSNASSFTLNADGSFTYTPNTNFNGIDSFTYRANDSMADGNTVTVTLAVGAVNDAPVADADSYNGTEDTVLTVNAATGVLFGDTDVDGNPLNALVVSGPTKGSLALNADGSFTYTPNANTNGADSFTYVARDGAASSTPATVSLSITAVNDAPVAVLDQYMVFEDQTLNQAAAGGVLSNDTDVEGTVLDAQLVGPGPANASSFTLNVNGSFVYTPNANFSGFDNFTYRAFDGNAQSGIVTVFITITNVNDAPSADADSYSVDEDNVLTVNAATGVLNGDSDLDANPIDALLTSPPSNGSVALNADGSFTYTPNANYGGPDSFQYVARDGIASSAPATVSITVNPVNDVPFTGNDAYSVTEDGSLSIAASGVLANDSDVESTITASLVAGPASASSFTLNSNGSFDYTPNADFNGVDSFTYRASDGSGQNGNIGTVTITVSSVNDAPSFTIATTDLVVPEDAGALSFASFAQSISPGPANEAAQAVTFTVVTPGLSFFSTLPTINAAGQLDFTLAPNAFGGTALTITAQDSAGASSAPQVVQLTVTGSNDPPSFSLLSTTVTVDEDSGDFSLPGFYYGANPGPGETEPLQPLSGAYSADPTLFFDFLYVDELSGELAFRPSANSYGSATVTLHLEDLFGAFTETPTFTITVNEINDAPAFADAGDRNTVATAGLVTDAGWAFNITGIDPGDTASFTVSFDDPGDAALFEVAPAIDATGTLTFDPFAVGDAELTVTLSDGTLLSDEHYFTIHISDPALPPSLVSSTPVDGAFLSQTEAYAPGLQLFPMEVVFDDPGLDCGALSVSATVLPATPIGVTVDCVTTPGTVYITFPSLTSAQDGDDIQVDITDVFDSELPTPNEGDPVTILFTLDTQSPTVEYLDDVSSFGCRALNTRLIAKFNEPMDDTNGGATYLSISGPPTPVIEEPANGRGWGGIDLPNDTYYVVPRDLLAGGQYEVNVSMLTDVAGNPASTGSQQFNVCGGGPGPGPGGLQLDLVELKDGATVDDTIDDTEIVNGFALAAALIAGTDDDLELVFDQTIDPGSFSELQIRSNVGGGTNVNGTVTGNRVSFDLASLPGFAWNTSDEYQVQFNGCAGPSCTSVYFQLRVADASDAIAPAVSAVAGRRASSTTASVPLYRPEEPIRVGFTEAMDRRTFVESNFLLEDALGAPVALLVVNQNDDGGIGASEVLLRADRGDGVAGALPAGTYTLSVSGLLDLAEPQNAVALSVQTIEVAPLSPAFVPSVFGYANADLELDPASGKFFALFTDAMSRSSFVDTGDPIAQPRGFLLEEIFGGTLAIPLKGMSADFSAQGGFDSASEASESETVTLSLGSCCGPNPGLNGFRQAGEYQITLYSDLRSIDGTNLDTDYGPIYFSTTDDGVDVRPTFTSWSTDIQLFPAGALLLAGQPLETEGRFDVSFEDADVMATSEQITFTVSASALFNGGTNSYGFPATSSLNFEEQLGSVDMGALFPFTGDFYQVDYLLEDETPNGATTTDFVYIPTAPPAAPTASLTGPTLTVSGTIDATDAPFVESVEIGIAIVDESGPLPDIQGLAISSIAHVSRDATGEITYSWSSDVFLADITPLAYRAFAVASIPPVAGPGRGGVGQFSMPSAPFAGNGPPPPPPPPPPPFFSEYVEGSSSNKAIEIYNPANVPADLTGCSVRIYTNGSPTVSGTINLTATLAPGDVHVVCGTGPNGSLAPRCNQITGTLNFNGDDAVELFCAVGGTLDTIGQFGFDPGVEWTNAGVSTLNQSLARKCGIDGDEIGSDVFDPSFEWDSYPTDTFDTLGYPGCVVGISGLVEEDNAPGGGDGLAESGTLVQLVDVGGFVLNSAMSAVDGTWSMNAPDGLLAYVRYTDPDIAYGTQRPVTVEDLMVLNDIVITAGAAQFVYDFASGNTVNPDPAFGSIVFEGQPVGPLTVSLGSLVANGGDGPLPFPDPNARLFMNVDPGVDLVDITSPACTLDTQSTTIPLPAPLFVNPAIVTFLQPDCTP